MCFDIKTIRDKEEKIRIAENLSEYEVEMFKMGATLEGIKWYRDKLKETWG